MYCVSVLLTGTSEDPDINVKSNEVYGVSSGVGQSTDTDHVYSTVIIQEADREEETANIELRPIQGSSTTNINQCMILLTDYLTMIF